MAVPSWARRTAKRILPAVVYRAAAGLAVTVGEWQARRRQLEQHRIQFAGAPPARAPSPFTFAIGGDNPLEALGEKYLPTKRRQNYLVYYWMHLRDVRTSVRRVLEIGLQTDRSIRMWEEFFPNAIIYGVDIDPKCRAFEGGRRRVMIGDQSDPAFLRQIVDHSGEAFDVVIDDGSHVVAHQLKSFDFLFPLMSEHGIYVIEDTGGCVEDYGLRTAKSLQGLVENIMYWPKGFPAQDWPYLAAFGDEATWASKNVIGLAFYRWMIFVMRGRNPEDNPFLESLSAKRSRS